MPLVSGFTQLQTYVIPDGCTCAEVFFVADGYGYYYFTSTIIIVIIHRILSRRFWQSVEQKLQQNSIELV